jgi:adenylosuccinate synthase
MPITVVIGAQWGDEGKGRYVDWFAADAQIVARYAGGDNAGHTVAVAGTVYKMHLIPSGILHTGVMAIMGNGMVINPVNLVAEMQRLREEGVSVTPDNLMISPRAHIITPAHIALDRAKEVARGGKAIGTTLRGIGPAYLDKTGRKGLRTGLLLNSEDFAEALTESLTAHNQTLIADGHDPVDIETSVQTYLDAADHLRPYIHDTSIYLSQRLADGATVICEGAQGTLLDIDHGSYPYVTSSNPTVGGALTGLGIGATHVNRVVGVAKAFSTRVGGGPMPTEEDGAIADRLRGTGDNYWDEFGTTTGRPRRCGWLDTALLRYSVAVNGFTELLLTKLDVLSGFEQLKVAVAYEINGERHDYPPSTVTDLARATPIYETLAGWSEDISGARTLEDLPNAAQQYIKRVEDLCGVPIKFVSVGPERHQTVEL